jgi:branched-chain amino acid transport system permease protein
MVRKYADDLRLFPTWSRRVVLLGLVALYLGMPVLLTSSVLGGDSELWADVLALAGITAIGALSLNLLTGYTGQPSLGHAAFIGIGAFTAGYLGGAQSPHGYDLNLWVYLFVAMVIGGLVGFLIGLPALRLRGNYLVIVTVGLVFVALYVFKKIDDFFGSTITGGNAGSPMPSKAVVYNVAGHKLDLLSHFKAFGVTMGPKQGLMYLAWGIAAIVALLFKNIIRTRPGRALQAVRDRDVAAEVVGVSLFRYKVGAFVVSSAIAALAGALYGLYLGYLTPDQTSLGLSLSIQFLAIIVVGGIGTMYGPVLGAILVGALPKLIDLYATSIPLLNKIVTTDPNKSGFTKGALSTVIYALLIIVFLVLEPRGLAGIWRRVRAYFKSWPFSY